MNSSNLAGGNPAEGAYKTAFTQSRMRLRSLKPSEITRRALCRFDESGSAFVLTSFGENVEISYPAGKVKSTDTGSELPMDWSLILLNYLSSAVELPLVQEPASYRELPQGNVFYPNINIHVLRVLGDFFTECDKDKLLKILMKLGFKPVESRADLAVDGSFAPRVPVMLRFWEGEDEIPSSCQILFDRTVSEQMHIEDIAVICTTLRELILSRYREGKL